MAKKNSSKKQSRNNSKPKSLPNTPSLYVLASEGTRDGLVSSIDAAQQLIYDAFEATTPRQQIALACRALEISPDCADAYVILADYADTLPEALDLYEQGVAAGERALCKKQFKEYEGCFWGFHETRPYMRALEGLMECLRDMGRPEEALQQAREMLRLNPNDNQGIRYQMVTILLEQEKHDELTQLLETYHDDGSAIWAYTNALLAFRLEGNTTRSQETLKAATKVNAFVPDYIAHIKPMPRETPEYISRGGEDEAIDYAGQFLPSWKETAGATAWLRSTLNLTSPTAPTRKLPPWSRVRAALAHLPVDSEETWEIDIRPILAPIDSGRDSQWMLAAFNTTIDHPTHVDFLDNRPKDSEVWDFLISAFRLQHDEEPHLPGKLRVPRKNWFRLWHKKLAELGIDCEVVQPLEQIDRWFAMALPKLEQAQEMTGDAGPNREQWEKLETLPQNSEESWLADVQQLPVWLQVAGQPVRPWVCLIADFKSQAVLASALEMEQPSENFLLKNVYKAMCSSELGISHRPETIYVASEQQRKILAPQLQPLSIVCEVSSDMELIQNLVTQLSNHLGSPGQNTALVHSPGVTMEQLGSFFKAAAQFYLARPWRQVSFDTVIRVSSNRLTAGPWYAVVMGQSGIELGLALYEDEQLLRDLLSGALSEEDSRRRTSAISVTYGESFDLAATDLDAVQQYGWPVATSEAYPCVMRVNPGMALRTPLKWELELLEGCLRAIPDFLVLQASKAVVPVTLSGTNFEFCFEQLTV